MLIYTLFHIPVIQNVEGHLDERALDNLSLKIAELLALGLQPEHDKKFSNQKRRVHGVSRGLG